MIRLLCVGKNKDKALTGLEAEYLKRLQAFDKVQIEEVKDEPESKNGHAGDETRIKDVEADRLLARIKERDFVVLLDLHGRMLDSEQFARKRDEWSSRPGDLVFVIAGSLGPGDKIVSRADYRWKLSDLTFTHLMVRPLVLEQVYRSFMIVNGRRYHK